MDEQRFIELIHEIIPQQLYHVDSQDLDDEGGGKLDETILVGLIAQDPSCLKHKPLQWFLDQFLIKGNEERELFRQLQSTEREGETCPDCGGSGEHQTSHEFKHCKMCKGTGRIRK